MPDIHGSSSHHHKVRGEEWIFIKRSAKTFLFNKTINQALMGYFRCYLYTAKSRNCCKYKYGYWIGKEYGRFSLPNGKVLHNEMLLADSKKYKLSFIFIPTLYICCCNVDYSRTPSSVY